MSRTLVLHLGTGKTGTSAIQRFLADNRSWLAARGVLVPQTPGRGRHTLLSLYGKPDTRVVAQPAWRTTGFTTPAEMRDWLTRALTAEIRESPCDTVVMSDEALFGAGPSAMSALQQGFAGLFDRTLLVVYLRRQDAHARTRYKQTLVEGKDHTLSAFLEKNLRNGLWRYADRLDAVAAACPAARIVARPYAKGWLHEGSVVADFLGVIGLPGAGVDSASREVNTSLDARCSEFLRRRNTARGRAPRHLVQTLRTLSRGPDLRLPPEAADRLMTAVRDSNQRLVHHYLPDCAELFLGEASAGEGLLQEEITDLDLRGVAGGVLRKIDDAWARGFA
jgi:hypothetical protein